MEHISFCTLQSGDDFQKKPQVKILKLLLFFENFMNCFNSSYCIETKMQSEHSGFFSDMSSLVCLLLLAYTKCEASTV